MLICCLKQLDSVLLDKKSKNYQEKNKAMKQVFFKRIPMEEKCDLIAQFLCIILRE